jgi:PKD domain
VASLMGRSIASIVLVVMLSPSIASAHVGQGSAGIVDSGGISARSSVHYKSSLPVADLAGGAPIAASTSTGDTTPITTTGEAITPQDSFDPLDAPAPCTRRRIGGSVAWDYCNPSPAPDAVADTDGGGGRNRPPPPSPEVLAASAVDRAIALAPTPELEISPGHTGLTGLDSYFWLADPPETITATAAVPGLTVVAEARPVEFVWDFGDGNDKVTHDAGRPWTRRRPGSISHLYETKGDYDVGVEVIWEARWAVAGGGWTSLGYFSNSDSRPYPVQEMIAMLVRAR